MVVVQFFLDGAEINPPLEWEGLQVQASFEDSVQAAININEFTFVDDEAKKIIDYIEAGKTGGYGIFEGMPFTILIDSCELFNGFLHFKNKYVQSDCYKVVCTIQKSKGLVTLDECLQSNTFGYLRKEGLISNSDIVKIPYIVEKLEYSLEFFMLALTTYLLGKETVEAIRESSKVIREQIEAAVPVGGVPGPNFPKIATLALTILINAIYIAAMIIYLIQLITDLLDYIYPPVRKHKAMKFKRMLEVAAKHCGYELVTSIEDLEYLYHIPSRMETDSNEGIPMPIDRTYRLSEAFALAKDMFNSKMAIDGNTLQLHSANSPYWQKQSTWELPDVLSEDVEYNTTEIVANRLNSFTTDIRDGWTVESYRGTSYGINVRPISVNNESNVTICGFAETNYRVALGNRKTGLTAFEQAVKVVAQIADALINTFGGSSNLAGRVKNRVGMLKQENRQHSVAKMVWLNGDLKLPNGHKDLFSAKTLYQKYGNHDSFVLNNFGGQKRIFTSVEVPFCLHDYKEITNNSYFFKNGQVGKIVSLQWIPEENKAIIDYWITEIYTTNLKEVYVEET